MPKLLVLTMTLVGGVSLTVVGLWGAAVPQPRATALLGGMTAMFAVLCGLLAFLCRKEVPRPSDDMRALGLGIIAVGDFVYWAFLTW